MIQNSGLDDQKHLQHLLAHKLGKSKHEGQCISTLQVRLTQEAMCS